MSDAFYIDIRDNTVVPLLIEFGTTYTITKPGITNTDTLTRGAPTTVDALGVVSTGEEARGFASGSVQGEQTIWESKRVLLLSPLTDLDRGDSITVDGVIHSLEQVRELKPANITVLFILDLTK